MSEIFLSYIGDSPSGLSGRYPPNRSQWAAQGRAVLVRAVIQADPVITAAMVAAVSSLCRYGIFQVRIDGGKRGSPRYPCPS